MCYTGATLALVRIIYWFQLNGRIGPIVINIGRVVPDLITVIITFFVILFAFGLGIFYFVVPTSVINKNVPFHDSGFWIYNEKGEKFNTTDWPVIFGNLMHDMAWSILNPGPDDEVSGNDYGAEIMFASYQIVVIIIILNLLIAMMNVTMQKLQDKKLLYWKFARTSLWLEFMEGGIVLPPPLLLFPVILTLLVKLTTIFANGFRWIFSKSQPTDVFDSQKMVKENYNEQISSIEKPCKFNLNQFTRRQAHAKLVTTLIKRLNDTKKSGSTVVATASTNDVGLSEKYQSYGQGPSKKLECENSKESLV